MTTSIASRGRVLPTLMTAVIIAGLVALGLWQLERRDEKHALMAALTERLAAAPVALPERARWSALNRERDEFRRVTFTATFKPAPAEVYTSGSALRADVTGVGRFVFQPAVTPQGETVVIDRGFVPEGAAAQAPPTAPVTLTGYLRFPESPGWLTPAPDAGKRLWFARDHLAMSQTLDWGEVAPFYIDLESSAPTSGLPRPGPLAVHLRDDHLQYAITWFGLAAAVLIAFLVWLHGTRRALSATA